MVGQFSTPIDSMVWACAYPKSLMASFVIEDSPYEVSKGRVTSPLLGPELAAR